MRCLFGLLAVLFISSKGRAEFLPQFRETHPAWSEMGGPGSPNETLPEKAAGILEKAPAGVVVAVGTERALLDAILAPRATHVFVTDVRPEVVRFHELNSALLKLSKSREDYVRLRLEASPSQWQTRASNAGNLSPQERELLGSSEAYGWWKKQIRSNRDNWALFHNSERYHFREVNYLKDDAQFARVKWLADHDRIQAHAMDLSDRAMVEKLVKALAEAKPRLMLSVLDISNAWENGYISKHPDLREMGDLIHEFEPVALPQSRLLATRCIQVTDDGQLRGEFGYVGATFEKLKGDDLKRYLQFMANVQGIPVRDEPINLFSAMNPQLPIGAPHQPSRVAVPSDHE